MPCAPVKTEPHQQGISMIVQCEFWFVQKVYRENEGWGHLEGVQMGVVSKSCDLARNEKEQQCVWLWWDKWQTMYYNIAH